MEAEVQDFEREIGVVRLPEAYRTFLLATNGGAPSPDTIDVPNWRVATDVRMLFGIHRDNYPEHDLRWNLELFRRGRPWENVLPIGRDSSGDYFCIELGGSGRIVLFEPFDFEGRYPVSEDFDAFLGGLRQFEG